MGGTKRAQLTLEELIDLKEVYGVSVSAQVHEAKDLQMISDEHYNWWYNERIKKNSMETGWGDYKIPETIGRERRIDSRIANERKYKFIAFEPPAVGPSLLLLCSGTPFSLL